MENVYFWVKCPHRGASSGLQEPKHRLFFRECVSVSNVLLSREDYLSGPGVWLTRPTAAPPEAALVVPRGEVSKPQLCRGHCHCLLCTLGSLVESLGGGGQNMVCC